MIKALLSHRYKKKSPIAVHCSAGIGRTGTLIVLYFLMRLVSHQIANSLDLKASIFATVRSIREQRAGAVQTLEQYEFIYEFFALYLKGELN